MARRVVSSALRLLLPAAAILLAAGFLSAAFAGLGGLFGNPPSKLPGEAGGGDEGDQGTSSGLVEGLGEGLLGAGSIGDLDDPMSSLADMGGATGNTTSVVPGPPANAQGGDAGEGTPESGSDGSEAGEASEGQAPGEAPEPREGASAGASGPAFELPPDRRGPGEVTCFRIYEGVPPCGTRLVLLDSFRPGAVLVATPSPLEALPVGPSPLERPDRGLMLVALEPERPTPIYSVSPLMQVESAVLEGEPEVAVTLYRDANDGFWATATRPGTFRLRVEVRGEEEYFRGLGALPPDLSIADYAMTPPPPVPADVASGARQAERILGLPDPSQTSPFLRALAETIRSFSGEAEIASEEEIPDPLVAYATSRAGCCRHRTTLFTAIAQTEGIPARAVINEGHAFAEVLAPGVGWLRVDLGGCGTYRVEDQTGALQPHDPNREPKTPPPEPPLEVAWADAPQRLRKTTPADARVAVAMRGDPVSGVLVQIEYVATDGRNWRLGSATTAEGVASFALEPPLDAPTGPGLLRASAAPPPEMAATAGEVERATDLVSPVTLSLHAPASERPGVPVSVWGNLRDAGGLAVAGARLAVRVDGGGITGRYTGGGGAVAWSEYGLADGTHAISALFAGDTWREPATAGLMVRIGASYLDVVAPRELVRGRPASVHGELVLVGERAGGLAVSLRVGDQEWHTNTNADGSFVANVSLAAGTPLGPATLGTSGPDGLSRDVAVNVTASAIATLRAPRTVVVGVPFPVDVILAEGSGASVPSHAVNLSAPGWPSALPARTNATGGATWVVGSRETGTLRLRAEAAHRPFTSFEVDVAEVESVEGRVRLLSPSAERGRSWGAAVELAVPGLDKGDVVFLEAWGRTRETRLWEGVAAWSLEIPARSANEPTFVTISAPEAGVRHVLLVDVVEPVDLSYAARPSVEEGRLRSVVRAAGANEGPLQGLLVRAILENATGDHVLGEATTDAKGLARFGVPMPQGARAGDISFETQDTPGYAPATLGSPGSGMAWRRWAMLATLGLATLGLAGLVLRHRRSHRAERPVAAPAGGPRLVLQPSLEIPDLPVAVAPGEELPLTLATEGAEPLPSGCTVALGEGAAATLTGTPPNVTLRADRPGSIRLRASAPGYGEASLTVRSVDYAQLVEEAYLELVERVVVRGGPLVTMTPGMLEGELRRRTPALEREVETVVRGFERSNYGTKPVGRTAWVEFWRALTAIRAVLGADPP